MPQKNSYHTVIIGAGPAGLAAAISTPNDTLLIEKNRVIGKKLLLTGQGMCNFTNNLKPSEFIRNCGEFGNFLKHTFYPFDNRRLIELLQLNGCNVIIREDGKVFPESLKAVTVRDTLVKMATANNVKINTRMAVKDIMQNDDLFELVLSDLSGEIIKESVLTCKKLIIATGGCNYPQTGSDGSGYLFADRLGHTIAPPRPALASVEIKDYHHFRGCAGNSLSDIEVKFFTANGKKSSRGDLLFTHNGLSGPVILNNSYLLSPNDRIRLVPVARADTVIKKLIDDYPKRTTKTILSYTALSQSIAEAILNYLEVDGSKQAAQLNKTEINKIISFLGGAEFEISKIEDIKSAMATAGGVDIKEVNSSTMESKIVKNLYFAGDVLSYALPSGGYSIQTAFSTGWQAGLS